MGHGRALVAVVGVLLAFPVVASAGVVSRNGGAGTAIVFTGTGGVDLVELDEAQDQSMNPAYGFLPAAAHTAQPSCTTNSSQIANCPADSGSYVFNMGGGNDTVNLLPFVGHAQLLSRPSTVNGGAGDDTLEGGAGVDTLNGEDDQDTMRMYGGGGAANGGNGNDRFEHIEGPATISGGPGTDLVHIDTPGPWNITLDGIFNDGPANANIDATVENVNGHFSDGDTITGSALANVINGQGGNDTLDGKGGADTINGGLGNDTIEARDGVVDTIDCGGGADTANVDYRDVVTNCAVINRSLQDDDGDGSSPPADCNDTNAAIRPGAGEIPNNGVDEDCSGADATVDADGDGAVPPADCDDANPARRPGARDRPKNGVDENCDGADADWRVNRARVANNWLAFTGYTLVDNLRLRDVPARGKVRVKCTGRGCPFKKAKRLRVRNGRANATNLFKDDRLLPGAVIQITITAPDTMGKIVRYTMRSRKLPARRELCDPPGRPRPGRC